MKSRMLIAWLGIALSAAAFQACAVEAKPVKTATDKLGNWIIEQYDASQKMYKGNKGTDADTVGMIVAALCHSPRDYKETNGPYISEPVKFLLAQVKEDGSVAPPEAAPWIIMALESAQNDKYKPVLEKLQFRTKHPATKTVVFSQASELSAAATKEWLLGAIPKAEILVHDKTKEVSIEGKPVKWGSDVAEALMKLQQKNGSFGDDLQVNALALRLLTLCYKSIK